MTDRQQATSELKAVYPDYLDKQLVTIKLTKEQVRKLLKKKEITIAQFKFIIE